MRDEISYRRAMVAAARSSEAAGSLAKVGTGATPTQASGTSSSPVLLVSSTDTSPVGVSGGEVLLVTTMST